LGAEWRGNKPANLIQAAADFARPIFLRLKCKTSMRRRSAERKERPCFAPAKQQRRLPHARFTMSERTSRLPKRRASL
jgi:hypothetical protein